MLRNIPITKVPPTYLHNVSAYSTAYRYHDNIDYRDNYSHDIL